VIGWVGETASVKAMNKSAREKGPDLIREQRHGWLCKINAPQARRVNVLSRDTRSVPVNAKGINSAKPNAACPLTIKTTTTRSRHHRILAVCLCHPPSQPTFTTTTTLYSQWHPNPLRLPARPLPPPPPKLPLRLQPRPSPRQQRRRQPRLRAARRRRSAARSARRLTLRTSTRVRTVLHLHTSKHSLTCFHLSSPQAGPP
jgi:hypothetical protein